MTFSHASTGEGTTYCIRQGLPETLVFEFRGALVCHGVVEHRLYGVSTPRPVAETTGRFRLARNVVNGKGKAIAFPIILLHLH